MVYPQHVIIVHKKSAFNVIKAILIFFTFCKVYFQYVIVHKK